MKDKKSFILQEAYTNSIDERKQLYLFSPEFQRGYYMILPI